MFDKEIELEKMESPSAKEPYWPPLLTRHSPLMILTGKSAEKTTDKDPNEKTTEKDPNEKTPGEKDPGEKDPAADKDPNEKDKDVEGAIAH